MSFEITVVVRAMPGIVVTRVFAAVSGSVAYQSRDAWWWWNRVHLPTTSAFEHYLLYMCMYHRLRSVPSCTLTKINEE